VTARSSSQVREPEQRGKAIVLLAREVPKVVLEYTYDALMQNGDTVWMEAWNDMAGTSAR